jgi:glycosyltransferase involved in cell wall biosynthesis
MEPKISIIIPTYNAEKYLEKTINSVIKQTIGFENLELIIVDDNSNDNTQKIIKNYSKKYSNIIPIYKNENSGSPGIPRNIGMKKSTAEYIMFLDSDDIYEVNVCETVYKTIKSGNLDFVWFRHQTVYTDDYNNNKIIKGNSFLDNLQTNDGIFTYTPQKRSHVKQFLMNGYLWDKIFKKEFLVKNNIEFIKYLAEDVYFMVLIFTKSVHWILLNNYIGYNHIMGDTNISSSSLSKNIESTLKGMNLTYEYLKKEDYDLINVILVLLPFIIKLNLNCKMKPSKQKEILKKYNELFKAYKLSLKNPILPIRTNIALNILTKLFSSNYIIAIVLSRIYIYILVLKNCYLKSEQTLLFEKSFSNISNIDNFKKFGY